MDSIKSIKEETDKAQLEIKKIVAGLEAKINHKITKGIIEMDQQGMHHVALTIDMYDLYKPKSNIVQPNLKIKQ